VTITWQGVDVSFPEVDGREKFPHQKVGGKFDLQKRNMKKLSP